MTAFFDIKTGSQYINLYCKFPNISNLFKSKRTLKLSNKGNNKHVKTSKIDTYGYLLKFTPK